MSDKSSKKRVKIAALITLTVVSSILIGYSLNTVQTTSKVSESTTNQIANNDETNTTDRSQEKHSDQTKFNGKNFEIFPTSQVFEVKPVKVIDGNHLIVSYNNEKFTVQLLLTNVPTNSEREAVTLLKNEISGLSSLYLEFDPNYSKSTNGIANAYVLTDNTSNYLEYALLQSGLADIAKHTDNDKLKNYTEFLSMRDWAKQKKIGLWEE